MANLKAPCLVLTALVVLLWTGGLAAAQPEEEPCPIEGGEANFTAADCPNGSCFAGGDPNGCGSDSIQLIADEIVPDEWPGGVDFNEACDAHDRCYFTLGAEKAQCDRAFLDALQAECDRAVRCIDVPLIGEQCSDDNPALLACEGLAQTYYAAVDALPQDKFEQFQADQERHVERCREAAAGGG